MSELFFRVRNLKKAFGKHVVLSGINLDIFKGEILGVIGTSGSGKTTLLHALIGFLNPDQGEARVLVEPSHRALGEPTYKDVHKNLSIVKEIYGFASQVPSFYDDLSVVENLKYFGSLYDMQKHTIETNMQILLHLMDLEPASKSLGKNLSGGMERRLDIACSLMHDPAVLILDEPTADLDPVLRNHIYDLIRKINNKETTIILASHHLADLEKVCDRIAILKDGKIFAIGTLEEIKSQFSHYHQVRIKVASKKYDDIVAGMKKHKDLFISSEVYSNGILFYTNRPNECAKIAMGIARKAHDRVEDLHIGKPSLDDIFIAIMEEKDIVGSQPEKRTKREKKKETTKEQPKKEEEKPAPKKETKEKESEENKKKETTVEKSSSKKNSKEEKPKKSVKKKKKTRKKKREKKKETTKEQPKKEEEKPAPKKETKEKVPLEEQLEGEAENEEVFS